MKKIVNNQKSAKVFAQILILCVVYRLSLLVILDHRNSCPWWFPEALRMDFKFYAIPKTGSSALRTNLRALCENERHKLKCLSWEEACGGNWPYFLCIGYKRAKKMYVSFTPERVKKCCHPRLWKFKHKADTKFSVLVDHFGSPMNHKPWFDEYMTQNALQFAVFRNPLTHYNSMKNHLCNYKHNLDFCNMSTVEIVLEAAKLDNWAIIDKFPFFNSQAQYLGYHGTAHSLKQVMQFVEQIDYIGLFEHQKNTYTRLKRILGIGEDYFSIQSLKNHTFSMDNIEDTDETLDELRKIQSADFAIYEYAKKRFFEFESTTVRYCKF